MRLAAHFGLAPFFRALASSKGFVLCLTGLRVRVGPGVLSRITSFILRPPALRFRGDFRGSNSGTLAPLPGRFRSSLLARSPLYGGAILTAGTTPPPDGAPGRPRTAPGNPGRGPPENPPRAARPVARERRSRLAGRGTRATEEPPLESPRNATAGPVPGSRRGASGRDDNLASLLHSPARQAQGADRREPIPRSPPPASRRDRERRILCFSFCLTFRTCGVPRQAGEERQDPFSTSTQSLPGCGRPS